MVATPPTSLRWLPWAWLLVVALVIHCDGYLTASPTAGCHLNRGSWLFSTALPSTQQRELHVPADHPTNCRLDSYLSKMFPERSRSFLSGLCSANLVLVNHKPQLKHYKPRAYDLVSVTFPEKVTSSVEPENIPIDILYEDSDIIVVNKPVGMVIHPAAGTPNGTFVNALLYHLGPDAIRLFENATTAASSDFMTTTKIADEPASVLEDEEVDIDEEIPEIDLAETPGAAQTTPRSMRPGIAHRLDKGTSGVLLAGKHSDAVSRLSRSFASRKVRKVYLVICVGHPGETTIVDAIGRSFKNRQLMQTMDGPPGKLAISHVRTVAFDGQLSAALVRIETGRTHQIRVHLKARRTPVAGDEDYGNENWNTKLKRQYGIARPLLHAYETEIEHPYTHEPMVFRAPLGEDMLRMMRLLGAAEGRELVDDRGYLLGSTDVKGTLYEPQASYGFVPAERVDLIEEDWLSLDLPEEPFSSSVHTKRSRT